MIDSACLDQIFNEFGEKFGWNLKNCTTVEKFVVCMENACISGNLEVVKILDQLSTDHKINVSSKEMKRIIVRTCLYEQHEILDYMNSIIQKKVKSLTGLYAGIYVGIFVATAIVPPVVIFSYFGWMCTLGWFAVNIGTGYMFPGKKKSDVDYSKILKDILVNHDREAAEEFYEHMTKSKERLRPLMVQAANVLKSNGMDIEAKKILPKVVYRECFV